MRVLSVPRCLPVGLGLGWRHALADFALVYERLGFVEVVAEKVSLRAPLAPGVEVLRRRGIPVIPHGLCLSLGGAQRPQRRRLAHLASVAERLESPVVSEHIAFVRAGRLDSGHLLPVPRTRDALAVVVENVRIAQAHLPVPIALENIAELYLWPDAEYNEADFVAEIVERTGALLLLDVANLYANARNFGIDPLNTLDRLPLERLAYVHVAGGAERGGRYVDTHADPVPPPVLSLLQELATRLPAPPAVLLERDADYPSWAELRDELDAVESARTARSCRG